MSSRDIIAAQSDALEPEEFQSQLINSIGSALLARPSPPCLLRAPTGSGKTFMIARVLDRVNSATPTLWLWFVPFVNLVQQTEDQLAANCPTLSPVMLTRGRNQEPQAGMVLISTAQSVARAKDRKAGYNGDGDDDMKTLAELAALARVRGLHIGLVVDEAHIGLDHGTEFGQFAKWLEPDYLLMASATPKDERLNEFLANARKGYLSSFTVSRAEVVEARLNKRYLEAVVYDLRKSVSTITDLNRTVLRQAWLRHAFLKRQLQQAGVPLTPLMLVQVANGDKTVEEAERELVRLCKVPPAAIGKHSADDPNPGLMSAIANDPTKEVLIFKQSAGTGFDAPRAFVLASTKAVNDQDFAMQFVGRVMRVAKAIRQVFPRPIPIPVDFDTAYVYLANAEAQRGFQSAIDTSQAVQSQLEGQTERLQVRHTASGALVFTNRETPQMPVLYDLAPDLDHSVAPKTLSESVPPPLGPQASLFSTQESSDADEFFSGTALMDMDPVLPVPFTPSQATGKLPSEQELLQSFAHRGLRVYRRNEAIASLPVAFQREDRPIMDDMARISRLAAQQLPMEEALVNRAVRVSLNLLREKEVHTELTSGRQREEDVEIVTDRNALHREATFLLRQIPQVEDEDVRIIISTLADALIPAISTALESNPSESQPEPKEVLRLGRDAACWVVRVKIQDLLELIQGLVSEHAVLGEAAPLPDAMLFPNEMALSQSRKNIFGVLPPSDDEAAKARELLDINANSLYADSTLDFDGGCLRTARFDGRNTMNDEERDFAQALDRAEFVAWWHRNPDQKPWSVRLVRAEHHNYFYPDFIVCLAHNTGEPPMTRLIETKESTKDAARKAKRIPKCYGKVLFLTRDQKMLRVINDDGSTGEVVDTEDLERVQDWMYRHKPT